MTKPEQIDVSRRREMAGALRSLAVTDTRRALDGHEVPVISAFVARHREDAKSLAMPTAALIIVIEGQKDVVCGADHRLYGPGEAFVLAAGSRVDVVNTPDPESGVYRALFIRFPRDLVIEAARLWPQFVGREARAGDLVLSADLCSAILHGAEALSRRVPASKRVVEHRVLEILLILAEQGVLPLVPKYVDGSVVEAVRLLVRHRLHLAWSAARVAAELGLSEASLRRRFRAEGRTLQALLRAERMTAAHTVLHDPATPMLPTPWRRPAIARARISPAISRRPSAPARRRCAVAADRPMIGSGAVLTGTGMR